MRRRRIGSTGCRRYSLRWGSDRCRRSAAWMRSGATSSSSAAICRIAVSTPWPISTRPVETVTRPGDGKPDPLIEARIGRQQRRQCRRGALIGQLLRAHRAAARSTARRMRMWLPQRQMLSSSASAISSPRRRRVAVEQCLGRDQDAGQAIAALARLLVEKGLLQRVRAGPACPILRSSGFPCRRRPRAACRRISPARPSTSTMQQPHCSRPQPNLVPIEAEMIAQDVEQRRFAVRGCADCVSIDDQSNWLH